MKKCLVSGIKEEANSNLPILDTLRLKVVTEEGVTLTSEQKTLRLMCSGHSCRIRTSNNSTFTVKRVIDGTIDVQDCTEYELLTLLQRDFILTEGNYDIEIENMYDITMLQVRSQNDAQRSMIRVKYDDLAHLHKLSDLRLAYDNSYGDFSSMLGVTSITGLNLNGMLTFGNISDWRNNKDIMSIHAMNSNLIGKIFYMNSLDSLQVIHFAYSKGITGNIKSLGKLTKIIILNLYGTSIYGELCDFIESQISNGRTDCSNGITSEQILGVVTFGGKFFGSGGAFITWESSGETYKVGVPSGSNSSIANCTKVYTKGYSLSEAQTKWPGKEIIRVEEQP